MNNWNLKTKKLWLFISGSAFLKWMLLNRKTSSMAAKNTKSQTVKIVFKKNCHTSSPIHIPYLFTHFVSCSNRVVENGTDNGLKNIQILRVYASGVIVDSRWRDENSSKLKTLVDAPGSLFALSAGFVYNRFLPHQNLSSPFS